MNHIALIDNTDKKIYFSESYDSRDEASARLVSLRLQADLNTAGLGMDGKDHDWQVYGPADAPFAFAE